VLLYSENELASVVARRGYRRWRSVFTMTIELDQPLPLPATPPGVDIRATRPGDIETIRSAIDEAFREDPLHRTTSAEEFHAMYVGRRSFDPSLWRLAWVDDELAGFVLAYPERHGDDTVGYVYALGVRPAWRRRGIARFLLLDVLERLRQRGLARATLGVDAENVTNAVRLYEGVGMRITRRSENWVLDVAG
jgi:mycothiol synthase